jgi:hypothetical protein
VDNGLVAHEIRKLFSQELGIAPAGAARSRLEAAAQDRPSTGMSPAAVRDNVPIDEEMTEKTGLTVDTWTSKALTSCSFTTRARCSRAGEPGLGVNRNAAGVPDDVAGHDSWNPRSHDAQMASRLLHAEIARKLRSKRRHGECGQPTSPWPW